MKKIRLKLVPVVGFVIIVLSSVGFWSCEKDIIFENEYIEYLDVKNYDVSTMSSTDMKTISQALQRLDIEKLNRIYQIKQTSGAQVNVSESLFDYIKQGFEYTNEVIDNKKFNSSIIRLKSSSIEGDEPQDTTHCASYALAAMGGVSYEDAASYSDSAYGSGGVPSDSMDAFFSNFYPDGSIGDVGSLSTGALESGSNMIYFQISDTTGHAVNAIFYDSNSNIFFYSDPQTGGIGSVSGNDVRGIYFP